MREYFVRVNNEVYNLNLSLIIGFKEDKKLYILHGETFEEYKNNERIIPTLSIPYVFDKENNIINQIVDNLIENGAKPTKPIKNNEELEAIKYHLEDMRKLVFKEGV